MRAAWEDFMAQEQSVEMGVSRALQAAFSKKKPSALPSTDKVVKDMWKAQVEGEEISSYSAFTAEIDEKAQLPAEQLTDPKDRWALFVKNNHLQGWADYGRAAWAVPVEEEQSEEEQTAPTA